MSDIERRVLERLGREQRELAGEIESLREDLQAAEVAHERAFAVEQRAWAKADRGRDRAGEWPAAMQALDDADAELQRICRRIHSLEAKLERLAGRAELTRRVQTAERLEDLRARQGGRLMPDWLAYGGAVWLGGTLLAVAALVVWFEWRTRREVPDPNRLRAHNERAARGQLRPPRNVIALPLDRKPRP